MGKRRYGWLVSAVVAIAFVVSWLMGGAAQAQQSAQEEIDAIKKRVGQLEEKQKKAAWTEKLKFSGQIGLRTEYIANEDFNTDQDRWRQRARLRFQTTYDVNEQFMAGFRLTTGDPKFPSTGWENLGGGNTGADTTGAENSFSKFRVNFDRMWMTWKPNQTLKFSAGKFELPFFKPQAIWGSGIWFDDDVQPSGIAETINLPVGGALKSLRLTFGQFVLQEFRENISGINRGAGMFGQQISGSLVPTPDVDVKFGLGFYLFDDTKRLARGAGGVSTIDSGAYNNHFTNRALTAAGGASCSSGGLGGFTACDKFVSDYHLLNPSLQVDFKGGPYPVTFTVDYVNNLGAESDPLTKSGKKNNSVLGWLSMGSTKDPGNWRLGYGYYYSQADSALAMFVDDDYQFTNVKSHMIDFQYRIWKDVLLQWDTYIQRFEDSQLAGLQGLSVTGIAAGSGGPGFDNPTKMRSRISLLVNF